MEKNNGASISYFSFRSDRHSSEKSHCCIKHLLHDFPRSGLKMLEVITVFAMPVVGVLGEIEPVSASNDVRIQ